MNTTIRNLFLALPIAAAAVTMAPVAAQADNGPVIVLPPPSGDPQGPVIANPTPAPKPDPTGPGTLAAPQPCPTHGSCGHDGGNGGNGSNGGNGADKPAGHHGSSTRPASHVDSVALPTRIDAGLAAPAEEQGNRLDLAFLLAGGAVVTASGAAFAARARSRA
jgi:hypothetical protein